jgi:aminocarboxymuconate-semialdehyde decarboxylase
MPIDVHAHYVPPRLLEVLERQGARCGVSVVEHPPACQKCLRFENGLQVRPFFPKLVEPVEKRLESMERTGIDRQILSCWTDIFGYGLAADKGEAWHRLLNDALSDLSSSREKSFSWLASGALQDASRAAKELDRAVAAGAVGGVAATNVEGTNLGERPLDEYWAAAASLDVPVFLHPAQPVPAPRAAKFALNQIAQYTFDTTLCLGSLISSGVLDRFPKLRLVVSHGGGALPYLVGRFDVMHARADKGQGIVAEHEPSSYLRRFWYDTILHDAQALKYLASRVRTDRIVLGSDDSFPPADHDPLASLRAAGFPQGDMRRITEDNPRELFRL